MALYYYRGHFNGGYRVYICKNGRIPVVINVAGARFSGDKPQWLELSSIEEEGRVHPTIIKGSAGEEGTTIKLDDDVMVVVERSMYGNDPTGLDGWVLETLEWESYWDGSRLNGKWVAVDDGTIRASEELLSKHINARPWRALVLAMQEGLLR